jgi:uncharacterized repeat protein (TIGR02543 family)
LLTGQSIGKATLTAGHLSYALPSNVVYDGSPHGMANPTLHSGYAGMGAVTLHYAGASGTSYAKTTVAPVSMGTYAVTMDATGSDNFEDVSDLELGEFAIQDKPRISITVSGGAIEAKAYDGTTAATVTSLTFDGLTNGDNLVLGTDYAVSSAAFTDANAGNGDRTVQMMVTLTNSGKASAYSLTNGTDYLLTGQSIGKATLTAGHLSYTLPSNVVYDGSPHGMANPTLRSGYADMGSVTLHYAGVSGTSYAKNIAAPVNAGTYAVTMNVAGSGNFEDAYDFKLGEFTISNASSNDGDGDNDDSDGDGIPNINDPDAPNYNTPGGGGDMSYCGDGILNINCPNYPEYDKPGGGGHDDDGDGTPNINDPNAPNYTAPGGGDDTNYCGDGTLNISCPDYPGYYQPGGNGEGITYNVTFVVNGGANIRSQTVRGGATITRPKDPTKAGDKFAGWYSNANFTKIWNFSSDIVTDNVMLYAKWINNNVPTHIVTFESNGGSNVDPQMVAKDATAVCPANPKKKGCIFGGWYSDKEFTELWCFPTNKVTGRTTLYAKWFDGRKATCTVTFNSNGGSHVDPQTVAKGERVILTMPTFANYSFEGWYEDVSFRYCWSGEYGITKNLTLYAKWIAKTVQVDSMIVNGVARAVSGNIIPYTVPCGDDTTKTLRISFVTAPGTYYKFPSGSTLVNINGPFQKDIVITFFTTAPDSFGDGQVRQCTLRVEKPFKLDDIMRAQLGGRLLMVIKNPVYNGNHHIQDVQWWRKNGKEYMVNSKKFYYTFPDRPTADTIFAKLQDTSGTWISTCPYIPNVSGAPNKATHMAVYPNPVPVGGVVHLKENLLIGDELGELEARYATFRLISVQGTVVRSGNVSELKQEFTVPDTPGIYHLVLEGKAGNAQLKIAVGQ